jgi:hypothetical protein
MLSNKNEDNGRKEIVSSVTKVINDNNIEIEVKEKWIYLLQMNEFFHCCHLEHLQIWKAAGLFWKVSGEIVRRAWLPRIKQKQTINTFFKLSLMSISQQQLVMWGAEKYRRLTLFPNYVRNEPSPLCPFNFNNCFCEIKTQANLVCFPSSLFSNKSIVTTLGKPRTNTSLNCTTESSRNLWRAFSVESSFSQSSLFFQKCWPQNF